MEEVLQMLKDLRLMLDNSRAIEDKEFLIKMAVIELDKTIVVADDSIRVRSLHK